MIQNLHTHTSFCDGADTPEEMVQAAIALGMDSLGFSGHGPSSAPDDAAMDKDSVSAYREEVLRLKEKYAGQLEVFLGLERDFFWVPDGGGWDYVIGSVHYVEKDGVWLGVDYGQEVFQENAVRHYGGDCIAFAEDYYRLVGEVPERTGCQIVGHFDLITKFNEGGRLFDTTDPRYVKAALDALDRLAERDVVFEINTGAMSRGYRTAPYPAPWLLRAMHERNLPICITSDCHSRANLLYAFPQAEELAWNCGYRERMVLTGNGFAAQGLERPK